MAAARMNDCDRFDLAVAGTAGKRVTYAVGGGNESF
jgi:hypothetical protein